MANAVPSRHPRREAKPFASCSTDDARKTSHGRGYNKTWMRYAHGLRLERVFCELCMELGIETPVAGQVETEAGRMQAQGVCDHVIPIFGPDDPLFWDEDDHWCLCVACDRWKSVAFDGTAGQPKRHARDRTHAGIAQRRREIIEAARLHFAT